MSTAVLDRPDTDTTAAVMIEVDSTLRSLVVEAWEVLSRKHSSERGFMGDYCRRVWDAHNHCLRWLDGNGRVPGQWKSRERVIGDMLYELQVAAYCACEAISLGQNFKAANDVAALLKWVGVVTHFAAHHPLGGIHRHGLMNRAGVVY